MTKAANFNVIIMIHKAQAIKLSNKLLIFKFLFLTLMCCEEVSMRIKWASEFQNEIVLSSAFFTTISGRLGHTT